MRDGFGFMFIGGCPRSGTTMLGHEFGRKLNFIATPESQFKDDIFWDADSARGISLEKLQRVLSASWRFRAWEVPLSELTFDSGGVIPVSEALKKLSLLYAGNELVEGWIDHTPNNILRIEQILQFFPAAKFVHIVRDPRAVYASVRHLDWGPSTPDAAALMWIKYVAAGLSAELKHGDNAVARIRYEDFVSDPTSSVARLARQLKLPQPKRNLAASPELPAYTKAQHALVGGPPDPTRAYAWENYITDRDVELIELICRPVMIDFGYQPKSLPSSRLPRKPERLKLLLLDEIRGTLKSIIKRRRVAKLYGFKWHL